MNWREARYPAQRKKFFAHFGWHQKELRHSNRFIRETAYALTK
jgi:hypothetical protein